MADSDLLTEDLQNLEGRELGSKYVLEKFLDRGGFGFVYRGRDKTLDQTVAIKVGLSSREFLKEARLAAQVQHDHIVNVRDVGTDQGLAYLVMDYLHGEDLDAIFQKQGRRLSPDLLWKLVDEIGDALEVAHKEHLIHCDLKPKNIILRARVSVSGKTGDRKSFVLFDFGIAAKIDSTGTLQNRTMRGAGSVEYMSPELLGTDPVPTKQSDIYAFGVILYQMITGRVPFPQVENSRMGLAQCIAAICDTNPPCFSDLGVDRAYQSGIEKLIMQCLEKDPKQRPKSMGEVNQQYMLLHDQIFQLHPAKKTSHEFATLRPEETQQANDDTLPNWKKSTPPPPPPGSVWPWLLTFFAFVAFAVATFYPWPKTLTVTLKDDNTHKIIREGEPISIEAGNSIELLFIVENVEQNAQVEYEHSKPPPGVDLSIPSKNGSSVKLTIGIQDPNFKYQGHPEIEVIAKTGLSRRISRRILLDVTSPSYWLPEKPRFKFEPPSDARCLRLISFKGKQGVFANILDCHVDEIPVRFLLIPPKGRDEAFYIMEKLVSNELFDRFWEKAPELAINQDDPPQKGRAWHNQQSQKKKDPVTNISALEAQQFATWLAGSGCGTLPSKVEWNVAAGLYDWPNKNANGLEKIENHPLGTDAWIGNSPNDGQFSLCGEVLKGVSPYGCGYHPPVIYELTRTFTVPNNDLQLLFGSSTQFPDQKKLASIDVYAAKLDTFKRINERQEDDEIRVGLKKENANRDPHTGFRVVLVIKK